MTDIAITPKVVVPEKQAVTFRYRSSDLREDGKFIKVYYQWVDSNDSVISIDGKSIMEHYIRDTFDEHTGDPVLTSFTDIVGFKIRQQDVGTALGAGLKTLIINKTKTDLGVS